MIPYKNYPYLVSSFTICRHQGQITKRMYKYGSMELKYIRYLTEINVMTRSSIYFLTDRVQYDYPN